MELRGFDSYPITLGDEMRGERASLGKSLDDAERDLRIKARMIVAIENCDLEGFPNRSVIAGYVRSYARYLGMDAEDCFRRFCDESGYRSPTAEMMGRAAGGVSAAARIMPDRGFGAELARSRFANPPARTRFQARVSLGAITSAAALVALIAGLSYGGYALLQDIQRVGFAPIPEAPVVVADAPLISAPDLRGATVPLPDADAYRNGGVLASVAPPPLIEPVGGLRRDGPISAIDPKTAGVFVAVTRPALAEEHEGWIASADDAIHKQEIARGAEAGMPLSDKAGPLLAKNSVPTLDQGSVALHAAEDAWIRVSERDNVIFEGILAAGDDYKLPLRGGAPVLKAGNAGGIFVFLDGIAYGPLGESGEIARNVSLRIADIRDDMPKATSSEIASAAMDAYEHRRAEASAAHP